METTVDILRAAGQVLFALLGLAAFAHWRRRGGEAAAWLAATFGALGVIVFAARFVPDDPTGLLIEWISRALITVLALFPYFLFRFTASFGRPSRPVWGLAHLTTAVIVVWSLLVPSVPDQGGTLPASFRLFVLAFLVHWTFLSIVVGWRLWRSGRGQSTVARRRMRTLAIGSLLLNVALLVSGLAPSGGGASASVIVVQLLALASAPFFYVGFAPPAMLRMVWRRTEERSLRASEAELMSALTAQAVADAMLPHVAAIFGGRAALLTDGEGNVAGSHGLDSEEAMRLAATLDGMEAADSPAEVRPGLMTLDLRAGRLAVEASPYTPFFGRDEIELLGEIGSFADLALERIRLVEAEREAQRAVEAANAELQSFVYSVSHDLKSPLITLLGYLDYLKVDFGDRLGDEGAHYIDRMASSASYMHALITDLLELSRIGRQQTEAVVVDMGALVSEIAREIGMREPLVTVDVGPLPVVSMNPLRARQLWTNLIENVIKHAGRPDPTIRVSAEIGSSDQVTFSCADNGRGIPEPYWEKVFGVFERLDVEDEGGTGIGLAICRKIVEHAGGRIWIADSDDGTDIRFELPAATPALAEVTDAGASAPG